MSYIFGIVDFKGNNIDEVAFSKLETGIVEDAFIVHKELLDNVALGYCHHPDRDPHCKIYSFGHLVLLADIRIYNAENLKTYFDFENPFEAFAKAFMKWGVHCANFINGDFAVVVIDRQQNVVHLIRDHIGTRPLVYHAADGRLFFASSEYGLARSGLFQVQLSEKKFIGSLLRIKNDYPVTAFQQIAKVIPGTVVSVDKKQVRYIRYWKPDQIKTNYSVTFDEAVARLRQLLIAATVARIEPGKTGVHVSGGLDSTGVACILADQIDDKNRIIGYSWTPEELNDAGNEQNEKEYIDAFTAEKGVRVRYLKLDENEYAKDGIVPEFATMNIEYPTIRMAADDGVATLFSGWGGDEFLSLGTRGTFNHLFFRLKLFSLYQMLRKKGFRYIKYFALTEVLPLFIPFGLFPSFKGADGSGLKLLKPSLIKKHWRFIFFHSRKNIYGYGSRKGFIMNLLKNYHIPNRMDTWAYFAEKYGFEYKYPLLDKDVLDYWFSLPVRFTYEKFESRLLYREVMKGLLIESIRTRKDKSETLRIKYSMDQMHAGKGYLVSLFQAIPDDEHLPFVDLQAYRTLFTSPVSDKQPDGWLHVEKLCNYLRNVELVKKYHHV